MARYVALLRAINVGGHTVTMDHLKALFSGCGFKNVSTFIASGNVLFDCASGHPAKVEARIGAHLEKKLGYEVLTFLRTPAEMEAAAAHTPFPATEFEATGASLYVMFLADTLPAKSKAALLALETPRDVFHVRGREIYWLVRGRMTDSLVKPNALTKAIGVPSTTRNVTTVKKLAALMVK